jgi:glycosyltransferase involved in cell wall biosynthesis
MTTAPVVINARAAQRRELGGVERWARELTERLPRLRPDRYRVLAPPAALAHRAGQVWEQAVLPAAARDARLILSPANLAPLASRRNVVIVHDAAPLRGPQWYGRTYATWHRLLLPRIARRAQLVLVPSSFVADELIELLDLPPSVLRVVAPGASGASAAAGTYDLEWLGLERPYVLGVGTDSTRKNFALLDAIAPSLAREGLEVVIAGSGRDYLRTSEVRAASTGQDSHRMRPPATARRLGYVPDALLPALYAGAAAFAMPSLYEGFGLPCIEAMAAGAPVVASDRAALPEACAGAATLVDPHDHAAFTQALLDAALDSATRTRLIAAGRARAAGLTWASTAEAVDEVIGEQLSL